MGFLHLFLLGTLSLVFPLALATHKETGPTVITKPSDKQDIEGNVLLCNQPNFEDCIIVVFNITIPDPPQWPCESLPEAVWENLGSIAHNGGVICSLWSDPSCQQSNLLDISFKPGTSDLFAEWHGMVDRGKEARYIGCLECQSCQ